uniref:Uncharacterized protein n=1 Tax=Anopheles maculatus TaxID=74869 RepID=A0A182SU02_9DIPT
MRTTTCFDGIDNSNEAIVLRRLISSWLFTSLTSFSALATTFPIARFQPLAYTVELFRILLIGIVRSTFTFARFAGLSLVNVPLLGACRPECFTDPFLQCHHFVLFALELGQLFAEQMLDTLVQLHVVLRYECDGLAGPSGTCGTTNPMDVVLAVHRDVQIQHYVHVRNVETAGSNVGGDKNLACLRFELVQCRQPLVLCHLTVQWYGSESKRTQHQCRADRIVAGAAENHKTVAGQFVQHVHEVNVLEAGRYEEIVLKQFLHRLVLARHFHLDRIA